MSEWVGRRGFGLTRRAGAMSAAVLLGSTGVALLAGEGASAGTLTVTGSTNEAFVYGSIGGVAADRPTKIYNTTAGQAYCIDLGVPIHKGQVMRDVPWAEATRTDLPASGIAAIAAAAAAFYPNAGGPPLEGTAEQQIAGVQTAIWHVSDGFELAVDGTNAGNAVVVERNYATVVAFMSANSASEPGPWLSVSPATASGVQYAPVGPFTLRTAGTATASVDVGVVVDAAGNAITGPLKDGQQFWVISEAVGAGTVTVTSQAPPRVGQTYVAEGAQTLLLTAPALAVVSEVAAITFAAAAPGVPTVDFRPSSQGGLEIDFNNGGGSPLDFEIVAAPGPNVPSPAPSPSPSPSDSPGRGTGDLPTPTPTPTPTRTPTLEEEPTIEVLPASGGGGPGCSTPRPPTSQPAAPAVMIGPICVGPAGSASQRIPVLPANQVSVNVTVPGTDFTRTFTYTQACGVGMQPGQNPSGALTCVPIPTPTPTPATRSARGPQAFAGGGGSGTSGGTSTATASGSESLARTGLPSRAMAGWALCLLSAGMVVVVVLGPDRPRRVRRAAYLAAADRMVR